MAEYISREAVLKAFKLIAKNPNKDYQRGMQDAIDCLVPEVIADIPTVDVQPLSVVAEHIKERLYETAFNTDEPIASHAIEDMAKRIDFWIGELKDGDTD
jgi:hypothetical protein